MSRHFPRRTIYYLCAIAALLFPLYVLSQPATTKSSGGKLAQMRAEHKLSQADLGQIDPTSASMKLATFGMHGIAANILWSKAIDYKEREDFTNFNAALQQITHLQPHFVTVWDFQGHNVAFNISVKFDDYRDRYHYVTEGFNLLKKGIRYNEKEPRLLRVLAQYTSLKIGRSDEKEFYRPLYLNDDQYHAPPPEQNPLLGTRYEGRPETMRDNWLVSKWWYQQAEKLILSKTASYAKINPFLLHSDAPRMQMQYAEALEEEGSFGPSPDPKAEWAIAAAEWEELGERWLPSAGGSVIQLMQHEEYRATTERLLKELRGLQPGLEEKLRTEAREKLTAQQRAVLDKPQEQRTPEEHRLHRDAQAQLVVTPDILAEAMEGEQRDKAFELVDSYLYYYDRSVLIDKYRDVINYEYWKRRCVIEQSDEAVAARKAIYNARQAYQRADLPAALEHYQQGVELWATIIEQFPQLAQEEWTLRDLMEMIAGYSEVLAQTRSDGSGELPESFPLQKVIDRWNEMTGQQDATTTDDAASKPQDQQPPADEDGKG